MSLNWTEIDLVLAELDLPGCFVQEIIQPDFRNLYLGLFRESERFYLRICLETGRTRLHRALQKPRKPPKRQRFAQLLHSRIRGSRVQAVRQINRDRIVRMDMTRSGEPLIVWIRLWGGASNILLTTDAGVIIDAFYRRPKRGEVTDARFFVSEHPLDEKQRSKTNGFTPRVTESVNEALANEYHSAEQEELRTRLAEQSRRLLEKELAGLKRRESELRAKRSKMEDADQLRHYGDLLYAYLHLVEPGSRWAEVPDFEHDEEPTAIALQPELSPPANAEQFYARARKAERRSRALDDEITNLARRGGQTKERLKTIETLQIPQLKEIAERGQTGEKQNQRAPHRPGLTFESQGFTILVGRNSRENDTLLRHHVRGNDTWLHARDHAGGYVFVRCQKSKSIPLPVLLDAGMLAVHYSKAKPNGRADLYYTQVKYLRRAKNGPQGLVLPTQEKNLHVEVDPQRIRELLGTDRLT